jgi:4-hydroxy-tetrahydrodipicolinate reductase
MNYALIGYGRMGRAIEAAAAARGHVLAAVVDRSAKGKGIARAPGEASWRGVTVAFEFTEPSAARANVLFALKRGVSVVCGTTGWDAGDRAVRAAAKASGASAVIAPNFSVGMNLFYAVIADAARRYLSAPGYDPWVAEWHHRAKLDVPSGTALTIAKIVGRDVSIAAVRAGHEPGRHLVGFDGPHDAVRLEHVARSRDGFAAGAVLAAEWLRGRRGVHGFDEVLDSLISGPKRRGGKR